MDNDERCIFVVRGVLETVKKLRWVPDVSHCHGWMTALTPLYIKKAYADDPCFKNSKIVYSIYNDDYSNKFDSKFSEKLLLDGIEDSDVEAIKNQEVSFEDLTRLALKYSDGVIQGSEQINEDLKKAAQDSALPFLDYQPADNYIDAYNGFYDVVWENANK